MQWRVIANNGKMPKYKFLVPFLLSLSLLFSTFKTNLAKGRTTPRHTAFYPKERLRNLYLMQFLFPKHFTQKHRREWFMMVKKNKKKNTNHTLGKFPKKQFNIAWLAWFSLGRERSWLAQTCLGIKDVLLLYSNCWGRSKRWTWDSCVKE